MVVNILLQCENESITINITFETSIKTKRQEEEKVAKEDIDFFCSLDIANKRKISYVEIIKKKNQKKSEFNINQKKKEIKEQQSTKKKKKYGINVNRKFNKIIRKTEIDSRVDFLSQQIVLLTKQVSEFKQLCEEEEEGEMELSDDEYFITSDSKNVKVNKRKNAHENKHPLDGTYVNQPDPKKPLQHSKTEEVEDSVLF